MYYHGIWQTSRWDKLFSHAPLKTGCPTAQLFIVSWKFVCSFLIWQGRARYTGNSIRQENVFWSFLYRKPPCYSLGKKALSMFRKGVRCINQLLDSEGNFVLFLAAKRDYRLGCNLKYAWNDLCVHTHRLQIPTTKNMVDRFRDLYLPTAGW